MSTGNQRSQVCFSHPFEAAASSAPAAASSLNQGLGGGGGGGDDEGGRGKDVESSPSGDDVVAGAMGGLDAVKQSTISCQVEDYNHILDAIGEPNYYAIKNLFSGEGCAPADTTPPIQVSFELFETIQTRFAATKRTLERTKVDLLTRSQQYTVLQGEMATLKEEYAILQRRSTEAEDRNTQLHQTVAKQEIAVEQLRRELGQVQVEIGQAQERLLKREDELQSAQSRIAEGLVMLSQKDAVIATLRRELGKHGRFVRKGANGGDGDEEGDGAGGAYTAEALQNIAADVEGRTQEARMKLSVADFEAKLRRAEQEKVFILDQHNQYLKHVENVVAAYEGQCMALEDGVAGHTCVPTPYFLSATFYEDLLVGRKRAKSTTAEGGGGGGEEGGEDEEAQETVPSFYALTLEARRSLDRLEMLSIDSTSRLKEELTHCIDAQKSALQVGADLIGFLSTFEKEVHESRVSLPEVKEEWSRARVPHFTTKAAAKLNQGVTTLSMALVGLLKQENEFEAAVASEAAAPPEQKPAAQEQQKAAAPTPVRQSEASGPVPQAHSPKATVMVHVGTMTEPVRRKHRMIQVNADGTGDCDVRATSASVSNHGGQGVSHNARSMSLSLGSVSPPTPSPAQLLSLPSKSPRDGGVTKAAESLSASASASASAESSTTFALGASRSGGDSGDDGPFAESARAKSAGRGRSSLSHGDSEAAADRHAPPSDDAATAVGSNGESGEAASSSEGEGSSSVSLPRQRAPSAAMTSRGAEAEDTQRSPHDPAVLVKRHSSDTARPLSGEGRHDRGEGGLATVGKESKESRESRESKESKESKKEREKAPKAHTRSTPTPPAPDAASAAVVAEVEKENKRLNEAVVEYRQELNEAQTELEELRAFKANMLAHSRQPHGRGSPLQRVGSAGDKGGQSRHDAGSADTKKNRPNSSGGTDGEATRYDRKQGKGVKGEEGESPWRPRSGGAAGGGGGGKPQSNPSSASTSRVSSAPRKAPGASKAPSPSTAAVGSDRSLEKHSGHDRKAADGGSGGPKAGSHAPPPAPNHTRQGGASEHHSRDQLHNEGGGGGAGGGPHSRVVSQQAPPTPRPSSSRPPSSQQGHITSPHRFSRTASVDGGVHQEIRSVRRASATAGGGGNSKEQKQAPIAPSAGYSHSGNVSSGFAVGRSGTPPTGAPSSSFPLSSSNAGVKTDFLAAVEKRITGDAFPDLAMATHGAPPPSPSPNGFPNPLSNTTGTHLYGTHDMYFDGDAYHGGNGDGNSAAFAQRGGRMPTAGGGLSSAFGIKSVWTPSAGGGPVMGGRNTQALTYQANFHEQGMEKDPLMSAPFAHMQGLGIGLPPGGMPAPPSSLNRAKQSALRAAHPRSLSNPFHNAELGLFVGAGDNSLYSPLRTHDSPLYAQQRRMQRRQQQQQFLVRRQQRLQEQRSAHHAQFANRSNLFGLSGNAMWKLDVDSSSGTTNNNNGFNNALVVSPSTTVPTFTANAENRESVTYANPQPQQQQQQGKRTSSLSFAPYSRYRSQAFAVAAARKNQTGVVIKRPLVFQAPLSMYQNSNYGYDGYQQQQQQQQLYGFLEKAMPPPATNVIGIGSPSPGLSSVPMAMGGANPYAPAGVKSNAYPARRFLSSGAGSSSSGKASSGRFPSSLSRNRALSPLPHRQHPQQQQQQRQQGGAPLQPMIVQPVSQPKTTTAPAPSTQPKKMAGAQRGGAVSFPAK